MKTKAQDQIRSVARVQAVAGVAIALAGGWLAGCSTTVYKQGDRTADAAWGTAMQVQTESQSLAAVQATLTDLVEKPAADLKPQFLSFSSALETLVAVAKKAEVSGNHLVRSNAAFMAAWEKQLTTIANTEIHSRSEARKAEVSGRFDVAQKQYLQAQDTLRPLIGYLQDLRKALSTDLTPSGLQAVKGLAANANTTVSKVQGDLSRAITELKALSASISSARGPAPD